eukprot:5233414-Amphidinium_carterae.2
MWCSMRSANIYIHDGAYYAPPKNIEWTHGSHIWLLKAGQKKETHPAIEGIPPTCPSRHMIDSGGLQNIADMHKLAQRNSDPGFRSSCSQCSSLACCIL